MRHGGQTDGAERKVGGGSRLKIALGAASLFLFLIGVKRTFRTEEGTEIRGDGKPLRPARHRPIRRLLARRGRDVGDPAMQ